MEFGQKLIDILAPRPSWEFKVRSNLAIGAIVIQLTNTANSRTIQRAVGRDDFKRSNLDIIEMELDRMVAQLDRFSGDPIPDSDAP